MAEGARLESVYTATYPGFESPPHRHILRRARTQVRAFFSHVAQPGGDEKPGPGFDYWRSQLDRLRAQRTGCPQGERSESIPPGAICNSVRPEPLSPGEREVLLFHHPRILFGQKIHQRPDGRQQAAPRRINRVNHFPSGFPCVEHPYQFP